MKKDRSMELKSLACALENVATTQKEIAARRILDNAAFELRRLASGSVVEETQEEMVF
jgi:hypothetical protein